jgi:Leucine-rich repeat (LRR) protein
MMRLAAGIIALPLFAASGTDWIAGAGGTFTESSNGQVTAVDLRASWITDADLNRLAQFPALERIDLSLTRITDRGLRALRPLQNVIDLNLYFAEQITDDGLSSIRGWKKLQRLNLRGTKITDSTLEFLSGLTSLTSLDIGYAQITDAGLDHLTSLTNLRELTIGGNKLAGPGLQFLRQLPQLTYLDLGGSQRTDSGLWSITLTEPGLEAVATVTSLKELRLAGTTIGATGLALLKPLANLERLDLQNCKRVGDDALPVLSAMPRLRDIDLTGTAVTTRK